jgi:DNA-binding response OmpR family regulator
MARSLTILVVEDNVDMADMYRVYLEPQHRVTLAQSARHARALLSSQRPDLVMLDLMLTDTTGEEFIRELCSHPELAESKVILLSGRNDVPKIAQQFGIYAWMRKPFNMEELLQLVERASG